MSEKGVLGDPWILIRGALFLEDAQFSKVRWWVEEEQANCRIVCSYINKEPILFGIRRNGAFILYSIQSVNNICISDDGSITRSRLLRKEKVWRRRVGNFESFERTNR